MKTIIKGNIQEILPRTNRTIQSGTFPSQQFILSEDDGKYKNPLVFNCWADKCKLLEGLQKGSNVSVEFFIKSIYSKNKWYTNLYIVSISVSNSDNSYRTDHQENEGNQFNNDQSNNINIDPEGWGS